jgi:epoxyqueuosine reductase
VRYPAQPPTDATTDIQGVESLHGRVASYAWSDDYHDVLPVRLRELAKYIEKLNGAPVPNRWYTDTGPLLEREFAQRAGLGWIGKNTCLINPGHGSYFLLAEILLGIDLPPDPPFTADRCGECRRCLEACPTGCILSDRTIDSRRCISYLTIELKGPIPVDLRLMIGDWIFGCDICQQVCPWNQRFARALGDPAFAALPGRARPELVNELNLTAEEFNLKFKGSPIKRAKRRGYLRNVAVALGNSMDRTASAALSNAMLYDPEPLVRGHAAWALGRIGGEAARQALNLAIQNEPDAYVQGEIEAASGYQD